MGLKPHLFSRQSVTTNVSLALNMEISSVNHKPVVKALLSHGRKMDNWAQPIDNVRKLRASAANEFLLGVMLDRGIQAKRAWSAAQWINDSLGDPSNVRALWEKLDAMENKRLLGFLRYGNGGFAFHRHYRTFGRQLPEVARIMLNKYDGDPRKIWNNKKDVVKVRERLEEIPGIGIALSRMAVLILARNFGLLGGRAAFPQLDVKPDIHVMRVFKRCGFIGRDDKTSDAIVVARELHPSFPAALDAPAYHIGNVWCRPTAPNCRECPITLVCPRRFPASS